MREVLPFFIALVLILVVIFIFSSYFELPQKLIAKLDERIAGISYFEEGLQTRPKAPRPPKEFAFSARVTEVLSGDTIVMEGGQKIKYISVHAPTQGEPFFDDSKNKNAELVLNKVVHVETDELIRDKNGTMLAYVWVDELMANIEMLKSGLARYRLDPPNIKYMAYLADAQQKARAARRGLWSTQVAQQSQETEQTPPSRETAEETLGPVAPETETTGQPPLAEASEETLRIVFCSNMDGDSDIYSIKLDGTGLVNLTNNNVEDIYPSVSHNGKWIAYTSAASGNWDIWVMDANGENKRQITQDRAQDAYPAWSRDDRVIFFESNRTGDWEVFRINADGTGEKRLTFNPRINDWHPATNPVKDEVVFESGANQLYIMDYDGNNVRKIPNQQGYCRTPFVSPDGKMIVLVKYVGGNRDNNREIFLMNYDGTGLRQLTDNPKAKDAHPAFSPDGRLIAYESGRSDEDDIIVMNVDGSGKRKITNSPFKDWDPEFIALK